MILKYKLICFISQYENLTEEVVSSPLFIASFLNMFCISFPFFLLKKKEAERGRSNFFTIHDTKENLSIGQKIIIYKKNTKERRNEK